MDNFEQKDIDDFLNIGFLKPKEPKSKAVIIKVNGEKVKVFSGKQVWASIGHAKTALIQHCYHFRCKLTNKYEASYYKDRRDVWNDFLDMLQSKGILEFVELD